MKTKRNFAISLLLTAAVLLAGCADERKAASQSAAPPQSISLPEPEPQPVVTKLRFSATGDNLIHDGLYLQARKRAGGEGYDFTALYENVAPFYKDFDVNWINQETLVTDELPPSSYPCFCTPGALGKAAYNVGWRVFAMSNNHSYDKGAAGIAATRRFWADMPEDVVTTGFFEGESDYDNIPVQEKNGVKIAYLAYTEHTNGIPTPANAEANIIYTSEEDVIRRQIETARGLADVVVVGLHWGVEGSHNVTEEQRALGQKIADWGADVIIGTHPHVIQPVEMLTSAATGKTVPIAYSLGNFVSTQSSADNMIGLILTFDITKTTQPDGASSTAVDNVRGVPMVMHYDANYKNARAYLYRDYTPEIANAHGVRAYTPYFNYDYVREVLTKNISADILNFG